MKRIIHIIFAGCLLLISGLEGFSQNLSNKGKEFWVGYGHHQFMEPGQNNSQEMVLYFSAEQAANVTVTVRGRTATQVTNYVVPANTVIASNYMPKAGALDCRLYDVPPTFGGNGGEGVFGMSIHITSNVPIVAYAHTFGSASSGATMLMPVETYGYLYYSINSKQRYANNCFSWAYCIASEDNTVVEITPSVLTRLNKPAGVPFTVTLNKGQVYQIIGANPTGGQDANEVSGTKFKSIANAAGDCYPIAVFSGSSRTTNPISCGAGGGDNDNQQCFPTQAWGKRYLTAPTSRSTAANQFMTNSYKVLVKDLTTVVTRNGVPLTGLQQNSFYFFESNTADYIVADKPIMVAQFMTGGSGCMGGGVGDPEMIYISPIEQGIKNIGFYRNTRENITVNYLTLIIPTNGVSSLRIDGSPTFDHTYPHPQLTGYTVVVKRWTAAQAQAKAFSDSAFTAITYGLGSVESYGYNAGTLINNLNAVASIQNTPDPATPQHPFSCTGTPVKLSVLLAYQPTRIDWLLSLLGADITPNADVIDNAPVLVGTVVVNGITYYKYSLPGNYVFNRADTFYLDINGYHPSIENCYNREKFKVPVIVKEKPVADFSISHSGCTLDPATFTGPVTTTNGYTISNYNWTFPQPPSPVTGQVQIRTMPPGVHSVNLSVVTADGCASDTTKQITIFNKPPGQFSVSPNNLCQGQSFTLNDTSSAAIAVNEWWWDFGNGVTQTVTTGPTITYTYPVAGTYIIRHVARSSASCVSDTITRSVTVYSKPTVSFTNNAAGCLPPSGFVQFTGTASASDGQAISNYNWNFGDPNATPPNPNTSTIQNPSHNYQQGTFNVTFSATTVNGCVKDTVMTLTFNLKPAFNYPALAGVCESAAPFSIANAVVTNGVTGTGIYSGPGTNASGMFNPATAGYGTHTIWYVFTSNANCIDSVSQTILVNARPRTNFTIPASGCLPSNGQVQFTNTSTIPDAQTMTWLWNFGDPGATPPNPNTSTAQNPTHNYAEGTYTINLQATSSNGCVKDTSITASFSVTPVLNYAPLTAVCENNPPVSVALASVSNGVAGNGVYSGPGTSANGMFDPVVAGYGTHTITYTFTSNGGCVQSTTQTILVNARPRTNFTIPASGCLPSNGQVQFTNTSTIPDGQTMTWLWNFGDPGATPPNPNTSTVQNPTHNYAEGTYTINLQATSNNGCVKDTSITASFSVTPVLNYAPLTAVCENNPPVSVALASVSNGVAGNGVYSGPGTSANGMFDPVVAGYGTHTITYTFTSNGGCVQSTTQTILVNARPRTNFTIPASGCLPSNGQVQFTNTSTIPDGQTMTWLWNFGDPGATPPNPNTSTLQNPTHNYGEGTYTINLQATSSNGCIKDTSITAAFSVTPSLSYGALTNICQNPGAPPVSVATATVTNGVSGNGVYSGPGTSANGMFDPNISGPGTHTITYTFTTTGGCVGTINSTIQVYPRPVSSFNVSGNNNACLGQSITLTNSSTISSGTITTWNWNLGNGNTPSYSNGNPFAVTYAAANSYTVQLVTVSNNGCLSVPVTETVNIRPLPVTDFVLPTGICMPGGMATFTNQSSIPDNSGLTYSWNFGDGNTSTVSNPTNVYAAIGTYNVTLTTTSSFGCSSQITKVMSDFYDKPVANFSVSPQELCQGADNIFSDLSTAPNSTVQSWNWNFADGTSSTSTSPTKRYSTAGVFNVQLNVTNAVGCVSDPYILPVTVHLQPVIDAGQSYVLPQGTTIQLNATANSGGLTFIWSPAFGLSSSTVLSPTLTAIQDQTYTLQAIGDFGCTASDLMTVKILKPVVVPNVFSPNGDNIHDVWLIPNLGDYPGVKVEVFNRYGQQVFYSEGYGTPWNGTYQGKVLPVGTYYYVIQLQNGFKPLNGSITILR